MLGRLLNKKFKFYFQLDALDCGPTCLRMIAKFYGRIIPLDYLREKCFLNRNGVSLLSINDAAEDIGFKTIMLSLKLDKLIQGKPFPCIIFWNQTHYVVLLNIRTKRKYFLFGEKEETFTIADPSKGIIEIDKTTFLNCWLAVNEDKGVTLLLEPTSKFYDGKDVGVEENGGLRFLYKYLLPYKRKIFQIFIGMLVGVLISLVFPFLTQALIDYGVGDKSLKVVYIILLAQIFFFLGQTCVELLRSWLMLHINTRVSLNILSNFLTKMFKLPINFFQSKVTGDIVQRIFDHKRIETFLTTDALDSVFSILSIIVSVIILSYYGFPFVITFVVLSTLSICWVLMFQKKRQILDYKRFQKNKDNQQKLYELVEGMEEIKLYGSETAKRWEWERIQINFFKLNIKSLSLEQYQRFGFAFFSQLKNILIIYIAVRETIEGRSTLGEVLSISYILGQSNSPFLQLVNFFKSSQDANLSIKRLQEIQIKKNEEQITLDYRNSHNGKFYFEPVYGDITIEDLSYQYEGRNSPLVLNNLSFTIRKGCVTAIVGESGSGKTTLMKILLRFYDPTSGLITIGNSNIQSLSPKLWRQQCGTVLQDGYIFSDTIMNNIAIDGQEIDKNRFENAVRMSNVDEFAKSLPLQYSTRIGPKGIGLSGGQTQRILIARAIYKNPEYLFFDEATSSLDANNEKEIMNNLNLFFEGKTVLIIAHRLSTVKNADQIIVLKKGEIVEIGNHMQLTTKMGYYFDLVKNQLELGN